MLRKHTSSLTLLAVTFVLLITVVQARAHAAIVWAYVDGDTVFVEAFYANGTKIQGTKVVVLDENKKVLLEGTTDKNGEFHYKPPVKKRQTVVVMAGESHIGDFELTEEDLERLRELGYL